MVNNFFAYNLDTNFWEIKRPNPPGSSKTTLFIVYEDTFLTNSGNEIYSLELNEKPYNSKSNRLCKQGDEPSFKTEMAKLFAEKPFPDIIFKVENEEILAHKAILINRCPFFGKMFQSGMKEAQNSVIEVPDMKVGVFNTLLEYLYCHEIKLNEVDIALDLFQVAEEYLLPELKRLCEEFLANYITMENVFEVARVADLFKAEKL